MMRLPLMIGCIAAIIASVPKALSKIFPNANLSQPILLLIPCLVLMVFIWVRDRSRQTAHITQSEVFKPWPYAGFSDLFAQIHLPSFAVSHPAPRWSARGLLSLLLSAFGGPVGLEGATAEISYSYALASRKSQARWSEQIRRTDASSALAASVAACFGAPFAGIILVIELGIGGKILDAVIASITAVILTTLLGTAPSYDWASLTFGFSPLSQGLESLRTDLYWILAPIGAGIGLGFFGIALIKFTLWSRIAFNGSKSAGTIAAALFCSVGLVLLAMSGAKGNLSPFAGMDAALWGKRALLEGSISYAAMGAGFVLVLSSFGTLGALAPVAALGVILISMVLLAVSQVMGTPFVSQGWPAVLMLCGVSGMFGAFFGAPFAGAMLAVELSQSLGVLGPALLCGIVASRVPRFFRIQNWIQEDLVRRGLEIKQGRVAEIMESILAKEAMVTDFETADQKDSVSDLHFRLLHGRYPFLPIVSGERYVGLLSVDQVEKSWKARETEMADSPLAQLLEAKDLLYRSSHKVPLIRPDDPLSLVGRYLEDSPCIPVVEDNGKIVGLLFVHQVRLAYEKAMTRKALSPVRLVP